MDPALLMAGAFGVAGAIGGVSMLVQKGRTPKAVMTPTPRPGWIARSRARKGVPPAPGHVGIGWESAFGPARLPLPSLQQHGYVSGAPGSGKTTLLRRLIAEYDGPVIVLDAKGDMDLVDTVWGCGGLVWEIGGPIQLDVLDDEPTILAEQMLEGETFTDRAAVYRAIAEHAVQRAAQVLLWRAQPREPMRILELLSSPDTLRAAIADAMPPNDAMAVRWLQELSDPSRVMQEGFQTFCERVGMLLDSPAGRSLGTGETAIRLQDVLATRTKLLIRLDPRYGLIARKVGAWTLVAMLRLASELRNARWQGRSLFVIDEPRLLGHEGRHVHDLFGTARDAGIGLVVADQGVAGLSAIHPDMPNAVLRLTAWQMVFRQGAPDDARKMSELFGTVMRPDVTKSSDGRIMTRQVEDKRVNPSWLLSLPTAHGWLRSAPVGVGAKEIVQTIIAAPPPTFELPTLMLPPGPAVTPTASEAGGVRETASDDRVQDVTEAKLAYQKANFRRLIGPVSKEDGCREWRGDHDRQGYAQGWWQGRKQPAHRVLVKWDDPDLPRSWDVHHTCFHAWCVEQSHLKAMPRLMHEKLHAEEDRARVDGRRLVVTEVQMPLEAVVVMDGVASRKARAKALKAEGKTLRQIAEELSVSYETVRRDLAESVTSGGDVTEGVTGDVTGDDEAT